MFKSFNSFSLHCNHHLVYRLFPFEFVFFFFTTLLRLLSGIFLLINFMLAERVWAFEVVAVELTCALFIYWWSSTVRCAAIHTRSHYTHTHDQRTTNIRKHSHFTHTHLHTLYRYAHLSMHAINLAPRVCQHRAVCLCVPNFKAYIVRMCGCCCCCLFSCCCYHYYALTAFPPFLATGHQSARPALFTYTMHRAYGRMVKHLGSRAI